MSKSHKVILIAGGGTGGHIYPGIAIARAVETLRGDAKVHFVGAVGGLEEKIVPRENLPLDLIRVGKLHRSVGRIQQFKTLLGIPSALWQSYRILRRLKPDAVLGVGGFASGPILLIASLLGVRTYIWEPNAYPGLANRILARFVSACLVVFVAAKKHMHAKRYIQVGIPIRSEPSTHTIRLRENTKPLNVLIFGGSQGARAINQCVAQMIREHRTELNDYKFVHQTGPSDFLATQTAYQEAQAPGEVLEFIHDMPNRYEWADVVICRAGASTVAEVSAYGKAGIFIPLPTAADDHQRKNAEVLVTGQAAVMIVQADLTPAKLWSALRDLRLNPEKIRQFEENVILFHFPKAAQLIANILLGDS